MNVERINSIVNEMRADDLTGYAAQEAFKVLTSNWSDAVRGGADLKELLGDVSRTIAEMNRIHAAIVTVNGGPVRTLADRPRTHRGLGRDDANPIKLMRDATPPRKVKPVRRSAREVIAFALNADYAELKDARYQPGRYTSPAIYVYGDDYYCVADWNSDAVKVYADRRWGFFAHEYGKSVWRSACDDSE